MDTTFVIETILKVVIGAVLTWFVGALAANLPSVIAAAITYTDAKVEDFRSNFTTQQLWMFDNLVATCVQAVEQKIKNGDFNEMLGPEKKATALAMIQAECNRLGIDFDVDTAERALEAAIYKGIKDAPRYITLPAAVPVEVAPGPVAEVERGRTDNVPDDSAPTV